MKSWLLLADTLYPELLIDNQLHRKDQPCARCQGTTRWGLGPCDRCDDGYVWRVVPRNP